MSRLFGIDEVLTSDDWYTPPWVFDGMGVEFDMDVSAPPDGLPWIPARVSLSESDDGLATPWSGVVWCNPPYSSPTLWCRKWATHDGGGCILIRADLSTSGPFVAMSAAEAIYVPRRRLQFVNGQGGRTGAVNFTAVILARGERCVAGLHRLAAQCGGATRNLSTQAEFRGAA